MLSCARSEYQFFRDRATPEAEGGVEACRAELAARIERCGLTCQTCTALCTSPSVRALVSTYRCSFGLPTLGLFAGFHESDAGLDIRSRYGADRAGNKEAHPEGAWREQYRVMVQNSVAKPVAPRNCTLLAFEPLRRPNDSRRVLAAISCRKPHRESTFGAYVPPLGADGKIQERKGFMVRHSSRP